MAKPKVELVFKRPVGLTSKQWDFVSGLAVPTLERVTPVDTGNLKSAVQGKSTSRSVKVSYRDATAPYAVWVNGGNTRGLVGRDMIGQTEQVLQNAVKVVKSND